MVEQHRGFNPERDLQPLDDKIRGWSEAHHNIYGAHMVRGAEESAQAKAATLYLDIVESVAAAMNGVRDTESARAILGTVTPDRFTEPGWDGDLLVSADQRLKLLSDIVVEMVELKAPV